jgi:methylmalonyl-CoA mutase cobalamin-binding subunit
MAEQARAELLDAAADADVMVILLSSSVFQETVEEVWDELVEAAKPESIWCLGAARSSLDSLDFEELEAKGCTVLTYQRVGVARIGSDTREELLESVKQKGSQ